MNNLKNVSPLQINDSTYKVYVRSGASLSGVLAEAISVASELNAAVQFEFNCVTITVCSNSNPELIYRDFLRAFKGDIDKNVGPYPEH